MSTVSIDRETEVALARSARNGDEGAMSELLQAYEALVRFTARRYGWPGVRMEDLLSEGRVGLVRAAQQFDPERGTRFGTYARFWVRAYMRKFATRQRRIVSPPSTRTMRSLESQLRRTRRNLEQEHGHPVGRDLLADALGVAEEEIEMAENIRDRIDIPVRISGGEALGVDLAENDAGPEAAVLEAHEGAYRSRLLRAALDELDPRRRHVVEQRYLGDEPRTLAEIGYELGISRERVRQLERAALETMRQRMAAAA